MNDFNGMDSGPMGWLWKVFPYIFGAAFIGVILYWVVVLVLIMVYGPHVMHDALKILDNLSKLGN